MSLLGLGAFYTLFAGAFALASHTAWPLVSFTATGVSELCDHRWIRGGNLPPLRS